MQLRHSTNPAQIRTFDTAALRANYLVDDLFVDDEIRATYTHEDRIVLGGARPVTAPLTLGSFDELRTETFFENREAGIVNVGGTGTVSVDGTAYVLATGSCLYIGRGVVDVVFTSTAPAAPASFYLFSATAHTAYPTTLVEAGQGTVRELGDPTTSNERTINQYIHANGVQSCQVVMGVTVLSTGSMWNTMPAHTHDRRTECYLYFDLDADQRVIHLMGEPTESRHLVVANNEAIISPSWSLHSGFGTGSYSFVWAMAGENKAFDDMDHVLPAALL
ncbi:5-dehydro-4-deoxy-D-glucuronate isomerase [Cryobacterium sp.]|jgi:4-deoxy-L-threo-5-hexosulose-uronate ketol-isomerase|uniref:5-dehydro-4-deoxy-D-glucuronate isomerase n=1 Tax=Cryobacterium sp. TaxID=1926290 RepID=UPI00261CE23D|nr:5-dehydro-4-deoxy-D-glucuronate isomerase [Cryobacterium sp.]MCU1447679.1 5-dehydro-4-deoxy-D-glucuronate isomerase [Cryobacterium sp.]